VSETDDARGSQPETVLLIEANVQWVAHQIVESHDFKFLESGARSRDSLLWLFSPTSLSTQPMGND